MPVRKHNRPALAPLVECRLDELIIKVAPLPGSEQRTCPAMSELLIAHNAEIKRGERVLVLPAGAGVLAVWAATQTAPDRVTALDVSLPAVLAARRTLAANHCERTRCDAALPRFGDTPCDVALLTLPKGRDLARLMLLASARALAPGGRLYLAGANDAGIKSITADAAALLGEPEVLAYKGSNRVVLFNRPDSLPEPLPAIYRAPGIAEGTYHTLHLTLAGQELELASRPGIFSWRELDEGSARLLEHLPVHPYDHALDLGCGYGVIGLWMAQRTTRGNVLLVDSDILAVECALRNIEALGITNATVLLNDGLENLPGKRFTLIASNPPFHSGLEVSSATTERWLRLAYDHLDPRGRLVIVANRFLPYNHVLDAVFGASEVLWEDTRFRVLQAVKAYHKRGQSEVGEDDEWDDEAENAAIRQAW